MNAEELAKFLETLAAKLTPAAQHVYDLAVRQALIDGTLAAVTSAVMIVVVLFAAGVAVLSLRRGSDYEFVAFIGVIVVGIGLFILGFALPSAITNLLNPEFAAIDKLIYLVRP